MSTPEESVLNQEWFYRFELPSGAQTRSYVPDHVLKIHDTRTSMLFDELDNGMQIDWAATRFIDFASHEGYFSNQLARRGALSVLGLEARAASVEKAVLINRLYGYNNVRFQQADVTNAQDLADIDPADITLVFGLIYHLENPVGALRHAIQLASKAVIVETQVVPNMSGNIDWGTPESFVEMQGVFGIIDETERIEDNAEASVTGICLAPSIEGLSYVLKAAGCRDTKLLTPPPDGYDQLVKRRRVMMVGYK